MSRFSPSFLIAAALVFCGALVLMAPAVQADPCAEFFQSSSGPHGGWLGLNPDGSNYGMGQSFTLNCPARLSQVSLFLYWGTDYGEVRSLEYGDIVHMSVFKPDGEELAREDYMIDVSVGSRSINFYFPEEEIILLEGTYIAALWTEAPGCGGMKGYNADVVAGTCYRSSTGSDLTSWAPHASEAWHTIVVDSDITPLDTTSWSALKAMYQ